MVEASSTSSSGPGPVSTSPRAPRRPGRWPRNWALLYETGTPAARVLRADWAAVIPITWPRPAAAHALPPSVRTWVLPDPAGALMTETRLPDPAGALMTETRLPSVRTDMAAAA